MNILGIDSTSKTLSVAFSRKDQLVSQVVDQDSKRHMVHVMAHIDRVLQEGSTAVQEIDLFCANLGPGDFTGTRIGLSVLKTFAAISKKRLFGCHALEVHMASALMLQGKKILSCLDARKDVYVLPLLDVRNRQFYYSIYRIQKRSPQDRSGTVPQDWLEFQEFCTALVSKNYLVEQDQALYTITEKLKILKGQDPKGTAVFVCGNFWVHHPQIAEALRKKVKESLVEVELSADLVHADTKASDLNALSYLKVMQGQGSLPAFPVYVREFVAFGPS